MTDWASLLMDAGVNVPNETDEFNVPCPFHEDTSPSLSINIEKGLWICHVGCGQGSLKFFLSKYLNIPWESMDQYLLNQEFDFDINMFGVDEEEESLEEVDFSFREGFVPEWIFERGFSKQTLYKWGCAVDEENSLIIPVYEQNKCVGWISRRKYLTPKYLYSKGLKKSRILFGANHIEPTDFVCVTEGSLDAMWLDQCGYASVALLGASMSKYQEELLVDLPTKEIVLCLDNDSAGQIATEKSLPRLSQRCIVSTIELPREHKEVQDIRNTKIIKAIINNRSLW